MAQLNDTLVSGDLRATGKIYGTATDAENVHPSGAASNSTARHVWFSDSDIETRRAYNNSFTYTPSTNTVQANISGSAANINVAVGNDGEIKLVGVSSATAGNFQPKIHPNVRAYYKNDSSGHILMIGKERGTDGVVDKGHIWFAGGAGKFGCLSPSAFTADRTITLPDATGTLALTNGTYSSMSVGSATSATYLTKTSLGNVNTLPVSSILSSSSGDGGASYVFGNITIPNNTWYRFTVSGEGANYCVITIDTPTGSSSTVFNTFKLLVNGGNVVQVIRVPYTKTTAAVGSTNLPVYVDSTGEIKACDSAIVDPDADSVILQYQTSGSVSSQFSAAVNGYAAHKKLYAKWAGTYTSATSTYTYEQLIPLSYVSFTNTGGTPQPVMFSFKDVYDSVTAGETNAGTIHTLHLDATQWTEAAVIPYAAANATTAANAINASQWCGKALSLGSVGGTGYISFV